MKNAKKLLSTVCALSMAFSSARGITAFAADIDYSIKDISINGLAPGAGQEKTVEEIKADIKALGAVNFDNYVSKKADVLLIVGSVNLLSNEDKSLLNVAMEEEGGDTYWKAIVDASLVVEAGAVYDAIKDDVPNKGEAFADITKENYKENYDVIDKLCADFDALSEGAQKMLADTAYLYKWEVARSNFERFSAAEKKSALDALKLVVTNAASISADTYADCTSKYADAKTKYTALKEKQQAEVDEELKAEEYASGAEILKAGEEAIKKFTDDMLDEIKGMVEDKITFENYAEMQKSAADAKTKYATLVALNSTYADSALEEKINDYIVAAEYFADADELTKTEITSGEFKNLVDAANALCDKRGSFTANQLSYTQKAYDKVSGDYISALNYFAMECRKAAEAKIDAIEDFDYDTWKDRTKWAEIGMQLEAAREAIKNAEMVNMTASNSADFDAADTLYKKINSDYKEANDYIAMVVALGTVGDVTSDSITLESGTAIEAAETAYAALSTDQQALVAGEYDKMTTARGEYDLLAAQAKLVEDELKKFNDGVTALDFGYETELADVTGDTINAEVAKLKAYYDAACEYAQDEAYGTKLTGLITAAVQAKMTKLTGDAAAVIDLRVKGEAVTAAGDALFTLSGIDLTTDADDIESIIKDFVALRSDEVEDLMEALAAMGSAVADYNSAKDVCANRTLGKYPASTDPYKEYEAYKARYDDIADAYEKVNPTAVMDTVDKWAANVIELFENIEDACIDKTAEATYKSLKEKKDGFSDIEVYYAERNHGRALSNLVYIEYRIGQYAEANDYITNSAKYKADYEALDSVRAASGEAAYGNALRELTDNISNAVAVYRGLAVAVCEIDGMDEAYADVKELSELLADRKVAFAFDSSVYAQVAAYQEPNEDFETAQEPYIALWKEYDAFSAAQKDFVTTNDLLAKTEAKIVTKAINTIDGASDADAAIAEADKCYNSANAQTLKLIENDDKLSEYLAVNKFAKAVADIAENITSDNMDTYKDDIDKLYAEYAAYELTNDGPRKMADGAYDMLKSISVKVVSYKCALLPAPDEISAVTDKSELDKLGAQLEEINELYSALPIANKLLVTGYAKYELGKTAYEAAVAAYDKSCAQAVEDLIVKIDYLDENGKVTMDESNYDSYKDAIDAARKAFDALTDEQKALVSSKATLEGAEADYEKWTTASIAAAAVSRMLADITDTADNKNYKDIRKALDAYNAAKDALSDEAKLFITEAEIIKASKIANELEFIEAYMSVVDAINEKILDPDKGIYNKIVEDQEFNIEYATIIAEIENAYNNLSREQKLEVSNYAALSEAKKAYNKNVDAAIKTIQDTIDALDLASLVKDKATEDMFDNLDTLIDCLSEENKARIGSDSEDEEYATRLAKLEAAKKKLSELKTAAEVMAMIDKLGDPEKLTEDNFDESKKAADDTYAAYNALAASEKIKVENFAKLELWKDAIDNFSVDHSGDVNFDGVVNVRDIYKMVQFALERETPTEEEFARANIVKAAEGKDEVINIYDILAAIDLIEF